MNPKIKMVKPGLYVMVEDSHLSRWVEQDGRLDHARHLLAKFRHLIPTGGTVVDVGAMIGDHTMTYAELVGPSGKVIAFEANPDVAECCRLNMQKYPWVEVIAEGLSDQLEILQLETGINIGASFVSKEITPSSVDVRLRTFDQHASKLDRLDFIKVDIEGYEPKFLCGAEHTIKKFRPSILMEVNSGALDRQGFNPNDIFGKLALWGYDVSEADGHFGTPQYDIIATPKKS